MADPKPFASLSSGLLARKGAAMPAMRRQLMNVTGMHGSAAHDMHAQDLHNHDDLGWNDMGEDMPRQSDPLSVVGLTPMPHHTADAPAQPVSAPEPAVVEQRRVLAERVAIVQQTEPEIVHAPAPEIMVVAAQSAPPVVKAAKSKTVAVARTAKAAFTLRLDPERHLRLRLACAVGHRSAQQIVTDALDAYLSSQPQIAALADQLPRPTGAKSKRGVDQP